MGEARARRIADAALPATFCPASACPLFAKDGSPWTGEKHSACPHDHAGCGWWRGFMGGDGCSGALVGLEQIGEALRGKLVLQLGSIVARQDRAPGAPRAFDCPLAGECEWQRAAAGGLCPPRLALARGLDPRIVAY